MSPGDANDLRTRLRRALPAAIKARDQTAVSALRSALAAIDNAEAVDEGPGTAAGVAPAAGGAPRSSGASHGGGAPQGGGTPIGGGGIPIAGAVVGLGAGEVERRRLTAAEVEVIVRREVSERRTAARAYQEAGRPQHAERLRAEADLLGGYLGDPQTPA